MRSILAPRRAGRLFHHSLLFAAQAISSRNILAADTTARRTATPRSVTMDHVTKQAWRLLKDGSSIDTHESILSALHNRIPSLPATQCIDLLRWPWPKRPHPITDKILFACTKTIWKNSSSLGGEEAARALHALKIMMEQKEDSQQLADSEAATILRLVQVTYHKINEIKDFSILLGAAETVMKLRVMHTPPERVQQLLSGAGVFSIGFMDDWWALVCRRGIAFDKLHSLSNVQCYRMLRLFGELLKQEDGDGCTTIPVECVNQLSTVVVRFVRNIQQQLLNDEKSATAKSEVVEKSEEVTMLDVVKETVPMDVMDDLRGTVLEDDPNAIKLIMKQRQDQRGDFVFSKFVGLSIREVAGFLDSMAILRCDFRMLLPIADDVIAPVVRHISGRSFGSLISALVIGNCQNETIIDTLIDRLVESRGTTVVHYSSSTCENVLRVFLLATANVALWSASSRALFIQLLCDVVLQHCDALDPRGMYLVVHRIWAVTQWEAQTGNQTQSIPVVVAFLPIVDAFVLRFECLLRMRVVRKAVAAEFLSLCESLPNYSIRLRGLHAAIKVTNEKNHRLAVLLAFRAIDHCCRVTVQPTPAELTTAGTTNAAKLTRLRTDLHPIQCHHILTAVELRKRTVGKKYSPLPAPVASCIAEIVIEKTIANLHRPLGNVEGRRKFVRTLFVMLHGRVLGPALRGNQAFLRSLAESAASVRERQVEAAVNRLFVVQNGEQQ